MNLVINEIKSILQEVKGIDKLLQKLAAGADPMDAMMVKQFQRKKRLLCEELKDTLNKSKEVDELNDLPAEAIAELELALQESYEDEIGTPHEKVIENAERWLASQK